jgi:long-chain acyl-CoA synthetase
VLGPGGSFEIGEVVVDGHQMRGYLRGPRTLAEVFATPGGAADATYLSYMGEVITYADAQRSVAGLAALLAERYGVSRGDRVAISMRNYPEFPLFIWAVLCLGAVVVPLNAWGTVEELAYAIEDCDARLAVVDSERAERIAPLLGERLTAIAVRTAHPPKCATLYDELVAALDPDAVLPLVDIHPDDPATILYTSGTTGRPKGAVNSHRNHCSNLTNSLAGAAITRLSTSQPAVPVQSDRPQGGMPGVMPMFHIAGMSLVYLTYAQGMHLALMYRWDADRALELIERYRLTQFHGVVTMSQALVAAAAAADRDLSSLAMISFGAAPVPPTAIDRVHEVFGGSVVASTGYGMTEATSSVASISGDDYREHASSVGLPTLVNDVRVVTEDGYDAAAGMVGELWVRGPNVVSGYWHRPEETAEAFTDGWYHTGDVVRRDDEGRIYLVDRLKDIVIRGGENVYCVEVEGVLHAHPDVTASAVVGAPHADLGEEVLALVQLRVGASVTEGELRDHVAQRLAKFKVPARIIVVDGELPRTPTGKVLKRELRARYVASEG